MIKKMCLMLMILMAVGSVMAGTLTKGTVAPTNVFASPSNKVPMTSWTTINATGRTDYNYGRGTEIKADSGSNEGYTMTALVLRKDAAQNFTGTTAFLTLYLFEGTKEMWDAGTGLSATNSDPFLGTGITTIYTETFALNDSYAEEDYITLTLDTPIIMAADMGWFIQMTQGNSPETGFRIAQENSLMAVCDIDGWQYQSKNTGNIFTGSPLEYYAVGFNAYVATNVYPTGDNVDPVTATEITWEPPLNYTPEVGYDLIVRTAVEDNEPNFLANDNIIEILDATASSPESIALQYGSTYWCQVTAYEPNGVTGVGLDDIPHSIVWSFSTIAQAVTLTPRYLTWLAELPDDIDANVVGFEGIAIESASVAWEFVYGPGVPTAGDMLMWDRVNYVETISSDPDLFRDYIGTDCGNGGHTSDVLNLTLSGLPSGSYAWKSYHYDAYPYASGGVFDVTVTDSTGSTTTTGIAQAVGTSAPAEFATTFTSDGSDVTLQFVGYGDDGTSKRFAMNGFELTGSGDPLYIDFTKKQEYPDPNFVQPGYQGYLATNTTPATFTTQSFPAFSTTVTVTPDWNAPGMEITSTGGSFPAYTATVDLTDAPKIFGQYQIKATATVTPTGQDPQELSGTTVIQVAEDACAAAKFLGIQPDDYDVDENCIVDLADFAAFAAKWMEYVYLDEPSNW